MKLLIKTEFGNPILRKKARPLTASEIKSEDIRELIKNMRNTLISKKMGVGLAAPQVGISAAISVIEIRSTAHRPNVEYFAGVFINPKIINNFGKTKQMWEGCLSAGKDSLFAKVPRYDKVSVKFQDEEGNHHLKQYTGLTAQVIQHEVDHLNGTLFVDRVTDTTSYMTLSEYKKRVVSKRHTNKMLD